MPFFSTAVHDPSVAAPARDLSAAQMASHPPRELPAAMPDSPSAQGARVLRPGFVDGLSPYQGRPAARVFFCFFVLHRRRYSAGPSRSGPEAGPRVSVTRGRKAVCLAPSGLADGARSQLERDYFLLVTSPCQLSVVLVARAIYRPGRAGRSAISAPIRSTIASESSRAFRRSSRCCVSPLPRRGSPCCSKVHHRARAQSRDLLRRSLPRARRRHAETWKLAFACSSGGWRPPCRGAPIRCAILVTVDAQFALLPVRSGPAIFSPL